jgi:hypothetical protein
MLTQTGKSQPAFIIVLGIVRGKTDSRAVSGDVAIRLQVTVLVGDRFMVKVTAESSDLPTLQNAARLIPMQRLKAAR